MTITLTLAHVAVSDLVVSERWYRRLFACPPHTRPMDGLIEWRFGPDQGVQLFEDAERAGRSTVVVAPTDFDGAVRRLSDSGLERSGVQPGGEGRLLSLSDPDGNRVVLLDDRASLVDPRNVDEQVRFATFRCDRRLEASPDRVWSAYAEVEQRVLWSVPAGEEVVYDTSDFSAGGRERHRCGPPGDLANVVTTRYLTVDAPRSFVAVHDICRSGEVISTDTTHFHLRPDGEGTVLTLTVQVTSLSGAGVLVGYERGHERTLDHLQQYLA